MASLYVDRRDVHLRQDAGAIAFYENGERTATVPLAPLTRVILRGKVTLEASPPRDPFNALISLTYTLAMAETAMALHTAGYDPCIGYYHQLSHSRESLACDLLEPLRPLADQLCLRLVAQQTLSAEHFSTTDSGCLLGKAGRARYYAAYEENATDLRRALAQEVKTLARLVNPDLPEPSSAPPTPEPGDDDAAFPWAA